MKKTALALLSIMIGLCAYAQETETGIDTFRKDADVYIISTVQPTGSGGREWTYYLTGQHEFAGMGDTVSVTTDKWNSWVFSTSLDAFLSGEKSYKSSIFVSFLTFRNLLN